jgi:hypothetical protein
MSNNSHTPAAYARCRRALILSTVLAALLIAQARGAVFDITIGKRTLYGPGPFPDQTLGVGHVASMNFHEFMRATVSAFNNGPAEPNVSGEAAQGSLVDGKMSDGTLINENIEMGNAVIINGQFNLILAAVFGGPSKGASNFFLDDAYNWTIRDDIAMDPGFPEGVVKINEFTFSTGPRPVPLSIQTQRKFPGGVDRVGTLASGEIVVGRLGDDDFDGHVDGVFFAMGQLPLTSPFLPGAPFVQRMEFTSTVPISPLESVLLTVATSRNCLRSLLAQTPGPQTERNTATLQRCVLERAAMAEKQFARLADAKSCGSQCAQIEALGSRVRTVERTFSQQSFTAADLVQMDATVEQLSALRPRCGYCSQTNASHTASRS